MRGRQRSTDDVENAIGIAQYVVVPKAQHAVTRAVQKFRSAPIVSAVGVLPAVGLDDQARLLANEVGYIGADRLLPTKLRFVQLA